jgi:hypothetical protein
MRYTLTAAIIATAFTARAAERLPTFPKRTDYDEARASLQSLGWTPVPQGQRCTEAGCFDRCSVGFEDRCKAYPEAETCRGTGLAQCDMVWRKDGRLIEVNTIGEGDPPMVSRVRCRVGC